jgi:acetyl esterase/lipase
VVPPAAERGAIKLSGRMQNPNPEVWEKMQNGLPPGAAETGVANLGRPELWVRNVSQPTLAVFLPNPSKATGAAMIVAPGGGFMGLAIDREGYSVAHWLNQRGIVAFVLKYRLAPLPRDPQQALIQFNQTLADDMKRIVAPHASMKDAMSPSQRAAMFAGREDAIESIRYVRAHAAQWKLSANRIGIIGFSAGALTALGAALATDPASRPDLVAPIYGGIPDDLTVTAAAPPAFMAAAADDGVSALSLPAYTAWRAAGAPAELHVFESGGHGFGVTRQGKRSDQWSEVFGRWLIAHNFAK